jgi:hypothetical protein
MSLRTVSGLALFAGLVFLAGCEKGPTLVEGTVTLNGDPLPAATVMFIPTESGSGKGAPRQANGMTDASGHYKLETNNFKGVNPGKYKVTVSKKELPPGVTMPKMTGPQDMMKMQEITKQQVEKVPAKYTNNTSTDLIFTIEPTGKQDINLELKGEGKGDSKGEAK